MAAYSPANPWRPFCSERCRSIDLGAWSSEAYRIPLRNDQAEPLPDDDREDTDAASGGGGR